MKSKGLMAFALASVLSVSALTPAAFAAAPASGATTEAAVQEAQTCQRHGKKQSVAAPENAIGKDAAKEKVLADAGVTAEQAGKVKVRLYQLEDGTVVYKVSFTCEGQKYSYQINATSGAVVDKTTKAATEDAATDSGERGEHGSKQNVAAPENAIGKDAAQEKALADAGVTAEQAGKVKVRLSQLEDGTVVYKVSFTCEGQKYSYQINATSGAVVDKTTKAATEDAATDSGERGEHGSKQNVAAPENAIGKDAAQEKALADAGVTAEQAGKVKVRLSQLEDGTVIYKVSFTCEGQKYSYQINATSGAVVDKTTKAATEDAAADSTGHGKHGRGQGGKTASSAAETATAATTI